MVVASKVNGTSYVAEAMVGCSGSKGLIISVLILIFRTITLETEVPNPVVLAKSMVVAANEVVDIAISIVVANEQMLNFRLFILSSENN
jgi:hypothetical protein